MSLLTVCESYARSSSIMLRPNWNEHVNDSSHYGGILLPSSARCISSVRCRSIFTRCVVFVGPCYPYLDRWVLVSSPTFHLTVRNTDIASLWDVVALVLLKNIHCRSIFTRCVVFVGPCYSFLTKSSNRWVLVCSPTSRLTVRHTDSASP